VLDVDVVVDRLRLCDACGSAHLSYLDVCPACGSLDIAQTRLLHCFTCSHVGARETFVQQERLRCPKCEAVLRHIGVDYDRPIEQQQCRHCKHLFVDAEVRSACMACDARSAPEQLPARTVAVYRLGGAGLLLARQGNLSPVLSGLDIVSFVAPALFERLIDWQHALARRYPESYFFSVIGVRVANLAALTDALGRSATAALVDTFAERLRALLRVSDITTRSDDHLWLLAPHTRASGAEVLMGRIRALTDATRQGSGLALEVSTTAASIPEDATLPGEGSQLMGLLASRLE
jgi:GGDEF domain-containing protein